MPAALAAVSSRRNDDAITLFTLCRRVPNILVIASLLLLMGCGGGTGKEPYLLALKGDPMAAWMPSGTAGATSTRETPYSGGGWFSKKPEQAELQRVFALADKKSADAAAASARMAAATSGWQREAAEGLFRKPIADATAHLSVLTRSEAPHELVVVLAVSP